MRSRYVQILAREFLKIFLANITINININIRITFSNYFNLLFLGFKGIRIIIVLNLFLPKFSTIQRIKLISTLMLMLMLLWMRMLMLMLAKNIFKNSPEWIFRVIPLCPDSRERILENILG